MNRVREVATSEVELWTGWHGGRLGELPHPSPAAALGALTDYFDFVRHTFSARMRATSTPGSGRALLFHIPDHRALHVVGQGPLSDHLRQLLTDEKAAPGWGLSTFTGRTPLALIREATSTACHDLLAREGFAWVEEVVVLPDPCLLELRNMGPRRLREVREAVPLALAGPTHRGPVDEVSNRLTLLVELVGDERVELHRNLLQGLAQSDLPVAALQTIAGSLRHEDLPPADPAVITLLRSAREPGLLGDYLLGRSVPAPEQPG